jgi:hypothetical protein
MRRHSIIVRLNSADTGKVRCADKDAQETEIRFIDSKKRLSHGIGQMVEQLAQRGVHPSEVGLDLAILAAAVTAADTKISRTIDAQDGWTREIDLYVPVSSLAVWEPTSSLLTRILNFLTGDRWRVYFRKRNAGLESLIQRPAQLVGADFDCACLFSGGLDSYVGAIDLLEEGKNPLFVSHYGDASTKSQEVCAARLSSIYGDMKPRHVRANVRFDKNDLAGLATETTTRGRSFIFFGLAALAACGLKGPMTIFVPENGLISLNVPLDPLRLGAWSTRTTHPFYMARWNELVRALGMDVEFVNRYRFKTKGEMLAECQNLELMRRTVSETMSCSSVKKGRWKKQQQGHCGYCTPCLIRRASIKAAFKKDPTWYAIADLAAKPLNRKRMEAADVRSFQLMVRRLKRQPKLSAALVHKPGPLSDYEPKDVIDYANTFARGIKEVGALISKVVVS